MRPVLGADVFYERTECSLIIKRVRTSERMSATVATGRQLASLVRQITELIRLLEELRIFGLGIKSKFSRVSRRAKEILNQILRPRLVMKGSHENLDVVFSEPHDMPIGDRIVLYSLIRGLQPNSYLEIGVRWGGSARIVANAMEANGFGKAVGLDPNLSSFRPRTKELHGRYSTAMGYSPEDTCKAADLLGCSVDFAFIDAVHTYSAVKSDLGGIVPFLSPSGYILFHDAFHQGINQAIDEFLNENDDFIDLGIISKNPTVGLPVSYCGLRLIKRGSPTDFVSDLGSAHARAEIVEPILDERVWDYDPYANQMGSPLGRPEKVENTD